MVMPRSRSISMESSTCSFISRACKPPVVWIRRSASVDLPWSICATMAKLRMLEIGVGVMGAGYPSSPDAATILRHFNGASSRQADSTSVKNALRTGHVYCINFARGFPRAPAAATKPAAFGGTAPGIGVGPQNRPLAGGRFCDPPCVVLDLHPDQPQGGAGRPHGRRRSVRLGPEVPARLRQTSTAGGLGGRSLVQAVSGYRLGHLRAGDGNAGLWPRDLLVDRGACGGLPPCVLCRGDAGALSDLQFQGVQI